MCTAPTQCWGTWCHSHACPKGSFKASPPQSKPYAISDPCPCSKNSLHVRCLHCLGAALALPVRRPHSACVLHARCLCAACTLPCALPVRCHARCLCPAMHAACALPCAACVLPCALPVCCHYIRMWATCMSLSPCPVFPLCPFARSCPQGLGGVRPWRGHGPPFFFSLRTCFPLKEHYKPFSEFLEETSEWLRRYNRIFT